MVIACTDDLEVNKRIYDLCRERYLICNIETRHFVIIIWRNRNQRECKDCDFEMENHRQQPKD
jgi:hypothetical protein